MKPARFAYFAPTTLDEALALRAEHGYDSAVLAGGQSLVPLLNLRMAQPEVVIDLGRVEGLDAISAENGTISFGAMVRQRQAERSEAVRAALPLLAKALHHVGHPPIRNRGTIGGSLAHADPAAELPAVALALDAELVVAKSGSTRTVAAADFFQGFLTTAVESDELLVEVRFPKLAGGIGTSFVEIARRAGDFATAGVGVGVVRDTDGAVADARIVLIGVGSGPVRAGAAEEALRGKRPSAELFADTAEVAVAELEPPSDIHATAEYRRQIAQVLVRRALEEATA